MMKGKSLKWTAPIIADAYYSSINIIWYDYNHQNQMVWKHVSTCRCLGTFDKPSIYIGGVVSECASDAERFSLRHLVSMGVLRYKPKHIIR
jgi:hypothetical protein